MIAKYREGAGGALLDEYERAIADLQDVIENITDEELLKVVDAKTVDINCRSVQTILSHVVSCGYAYAVDIRKLTEGEIDYPEKVFHSAVKNYQKDLDSFFVFMVNTFKNIHDNQLEQPDNSKKIMTSWGQIYDIEQITEHAIVHILRHRRQIEKFKMLLRGEI